jgi:Flp pilus assembly protein TadD
MLRRLARHAPSDSDDFRFAHRHLAELRVEREPWLAALSARHVVALCPDDDGAWAILGLSFTLLGHYRSAVASYRRAIALSPANPWYAHNLGHLLDVTMDRPREALRLLQAAHLKEPRESEIASSYVHALGRTGRTSDARKLLKRYMKGGGTADQRALMRWLEDKVLAEQQKGAEEQLTRRKKRTRRQAPGV